MRRRKLGWNRGERYIGGKHVRPDNTEVEVSVAEWELAAS